VADFCKQCSEQIFGPGTGDFDGMCTLEDNKNDQYSVVLCEGCGPTQVNYLGECVATDHENLSARMRGACNHKRGKLFHLPE
jgi:hypothetical protein